MVKCPHCGSTAQPKRVGMVSISANEQYFCENYKCGCGCYFEALYPREVEEYSIHYLKDNDENFIETPWQIINNML